MTAETLSLSEAAIVAGVSVRDVHRVVDEEILPDQFIERGDSRRILSKGSFLVSFYFNSASKLTSEERGRLIGKAIDRGLADAFANWLKTQPLSDPKDWLADNTSWLVKDAFVSVDFSPFAESSAAKFCDLQRAKAMVVSDPEILSGTPVIKGTRVPVYDLAASVKAGIPRDRILASYPSIEDRHLDVAVLYADAEPMKGRPRKTPLLSGAVLVKSGTVPRRKKA